MLHPVMSSLAIGLYALQARSPRRHLSHTEILVNHLLFTALELSAPPVFQDPFLYEQFHVVEDHVTFQNRIFF